MKAKNNQIKRYSTIQRWVGWDVSISPYGVCFTKFLSDPIWIWNGVVPVLLYDRTNNRCLGALETANIRYFRCVSIAETPIGLGILIEI